MFSWQQHTRIRLLRILLMCKTKILPIICWKTWETILTQNHKAILKDPRNLTWIVQRGCYLYQKKCLFEYIFIGLILMVNINYNKQMLIVYIDCHFGHIFHGFHVCAHESRHQERCEWNSFNYWSDYPKNSTILKRQFGYINLLQNHIRSPRTVSAIKKSALRLFFQVNLLW